MLIAIFLLLWQSQASDAALGYRFTLPPGFAHFPEGKTQQDVVDCWSEDAPPSGHEGVILCVQRLRGVLPREAMRGEELPPSAKLVDFQWKGFDIQGLHSQVTQQGQRVFVFVAQVPLRKEAVQLMVSGMADEEERGKAIMSSTLASLEGETNWLTSSERSGRLGKAAGTWIVIAIAVVAVVLWRRRRRVARA